MGKFLKRILNFSCSSYMIISFIINISIWISSYDKNQSRMLGIGANLIILLICLIISTIVLYKTRKKETNIKTFVFTVGIIYTVISILVNIIQYIIKKENFWNGYTLLIILIFSIVVTLLGNVIKKKFFIKSIVNFFVFGAFYYIVFIVKAGYTKGSSFIISIGIYVVIFSLYTITCYFINKNKQIKDNLKKDYNNVFI